MKFRLYGPFGPNTASTSSPSSLRSRPWSTNTQVSCLPTARASSTAATDESTPPERAHSTRPPPTRARRAATVSSTKESIFHVPLQPHTLYTKFESMRAPCCVCSTSGWNCTRYSPRAASSAAATGQLSVCAETAKPGAGASI